MKSVAHKERKTEQSEVAADDGSDGVNQRMKSVKQNVKVGCDVSELSVYDELSPGRHFDPKQLESLKKTEV